ncbi:nucleotidyltransferase domain-containing protein [Brevibacillus daliensis]|uniref:nucleotidyltransferase domain-containing protein n=1 Tax=Brevibacillus daliensis TaxID=2892995 RepID=UPI001E54379B|nr:nucleotidyltransferase domain-containing protein [Brevibacillus daliensis]
MKYSSFEASKLFIDDKFPTCEIAFLAGSASRGEETKTSDLDIVVFDNNSNEYRESFFMFGWRIECFIHNKESYAKQLASDKESGKPILATMIMEGKILIDNGDAEKLKQEASEFLLAEEKH